ncbi:hypothetical protein B0H66DRAFT_546766 [Apodospora peruviana]|uniref:Uncharacterized protein n=1 Tax=Apodospora peruviana TaxID=516989 RepID=A0AAE0IVX9_9PEZI|nr:hypothetical protein B0H66DRAFT_546766 [Apodospora peruviana]
MLVKTNLLQLAALVLPLLDGVAADCWKKKCSHLGLSSTVSCKSACAAKGYSIHGYETYTRYAVDVWVVCTCGTYHEEDCTTCRNAGVPCKSRDAESKEIFDGKIPNC